MRAILAQTQMELRLMSRRGENILITMIVPLVLLLFFASTEVLPLAGQTRLEFLVPGILTLAIMSTGLVGLGIATAYERHYGVLKRLGGSPLTRSQLIAAKINSVLVIELLQIGLLIGVAAVVLGWRPTGSLVLAAVAALLGTIAFSGLGLLMSGLRAETALAAANALYLILLLIGGIFLPATHLPSMIANLVPFLPTNALADLLRSSLAGESIDVTNFVILAIWAFVGVTFTVNSFKWE
jgi:ABC-2 type transport system permease protein